tara:strand:- start:8029 stop:8349 length:321 start_codon:yes stop_codon:yes gene_type:complete
MQSEILIEKAEKELQITEEEMYEAQDEALLEAMEWFDYNNSIDTIEPSYAADIVLDCLNANGVTHWTREAAYGWLMELMQWYMISLENQLEGFYENDTAHEAKNGY